MTKDEAMRLALEALSDFDYDKRMEAITVLRKALANEALNRMAENARELELDYWMHDHARKVWWDGEKLASKQIPLEQLYKEPAQQEPVAYIRLSKTGHVMACAKTGDFYKLPDKTLLYTSPPAQRTWVGLTRDEVETLSYKAEDNTWAAVELAEAKLKEKNNG